VEVCVESGLEVPSLRIGVLDSELAIELGVHE
jgi:hypothetical protein